MLLLSLAALLPGLVAVAKAAPPPPPKKSVMLWTSHPCMPHWPWPSRCNSTMIATFIRELMPLRDVVDRVAVDGYYIADAANTTADGFNGGLIRHQDLPVVVTALQQAGFLVEPLVGNGPSLNYRRPTLGSKVLPQQAGPSINAFRPYLRQPKLRSGLAAACAAEVTALNLSGLNFDLEFADCGKSVGREGSVLCNTSTDGAHLSALITETQGLLTARGARLSVDVGQSPLTWGNIVNQSGADALIIMDYGDESNRINGDNFDAAVRSAVSNFGARTAVGICPECLQGDTMHTRTNHTVNASDIARRFNAITAAGVTEVDYFIFDSNRAVWPQGPHAPLLPVAQVPMWWGAIRKWKTATSASMPPVKADDEAAAWAPPRVVLLSPGDDVQHALDHNPETTTFLFAAGTYRYQGTWSTKPNGEHCWYGLRVKNNTVLQAQTRRSAIFSGAIPVNGTRMVSAGIWAANISGYIDNTTSPHTTGYGVCMPGFEACNHRQDLFWNDQALRRYPHRVNLSLAEPPAWALDYGTSEAVLNFDPGAGPLELSYQDTWLSAPPGSNVTVRGLVIEKIANHAQTNTMEGADTVDDCEVRWAHGGGVGARIVTNNHIHHIGQLGGGALSLLENNTVEYCNYANYSYSWEAGG
jgi:hypothetical protein